MLAVPDEVPPKVFISYSWSSPEYRERVVRLASDLRRDGVDVLLDVWDLEEGQDAFAFMERAVTDPTVTRVLVLCDPAYAAKADDRQGGVGTETLIISPTVYREAQQTKFLPVLMERDSNGDARLPVYLAGRLYTDLSDPRHETEYYQQLLRRLHGKPERAKPPLGAPPSYLDEAAPALGTGTARIQFEDAVLRGRPYHRAALSEYLDRLADAFAAERIRGQDVVDGAALLGRVRASITAFTPYRDEFAGLVAFVGTHLVEHEPYDRLHRFFEQIAAARYGIRQERWDPDAEFENLNFLMRELALYAIAQLLRAEQFSGLGRVLAPYYVPDAHNGPGTVQGVSILDAGFRQLDPPGSHVSGVARLLHERAAVDGIPYRALLEAEFVAALRARLDAPQPGDGQDVSPSRLWWPRSVGWGFDVSELPLRVRLSDARFRDRFAPVFGYPDAASLATRIATLSDAGFDRVGTLHWLKRENLMPLFNVRAT